VYSSEHVMLQTLLSAAQIQERVVALERVMHFRLDDARLRVWHANRTPVMSVMMNGP
jgi:hypothetical protein